MSWWIQLIQYYNVDIFATCYLSVSSKFNCNKNVERNRLISMKNHNIFISLRFMSLSANYIWDISKEQLYKDLLGI